MSATYWPNVTLPLNAELLANVHSPFRITLSRGEYVPFVLAQTEEY